MCEYINNDDLENQHVIDISPEEEEEEVEGEEDFLLSTKAYYYCHWCWLAACGLFGCDAVGGGELSHGSKDSNKGLIHAAAEKYVKDIIELNQQKF